MVGATNRSMAAMSGAWLRRKARHPGEKEVQSAGSNFGMEVIILEITKTENIDPGIELEGRVDGLYVCTDPLLTMYRTRINALALSERLPTMYAFREYVQAGGLMSYGPNFPDLFRRAGDHVDKILHGSETG
jgi:ABC-type uncharacterized transport system substrate-binding protein